jgi:mono/diheme cytochrome c family protein
MTRLIPLRRPGFRHARGAAFCGYGLLGALVLMGQTSPVKSITAGVYSAGQASRGQQLYKAQCAECQGNAMEGDSGPPLAGDSFLSNWSAQPLTNFVDKIQKTMPFNLPGSLSKSQSTDLAAYVLQVGKFPAGQAELSEAALGANCHKVYRDRGGTEGSGGTRCRP